MWWCLALAGLFLQGVEADVPIELIESAEGAIMAPKFMTVMMPKGDLVTEAIDKNQPWWTAKTQQISKFSAVSDGSIAYSGGGCIEAAGKKAGDAARIKRCNGGPLQRWNLLPRGKGKKMIQLQGTDMCLDASKRDQFLERQIKLQKCSEIREELWRFSEPTSSPNQGLALLVRYTLLSLLVLATLGLTSLSARLWRLQCQRRSLTHGTVPLSLDQGGVLLTDPVTDRQGGSVVAPHCDGKSVPAIMALSPSPVKALRKSFHKKALQLSKHAKDSRSPHPAMQLDSLMRRGVEEETVVDNEFFNPTENQKRIDGYLETVQRINDLEDEIEKLEDDEFPAKTAEFQKRLQQGENEAQILEEAFAMVREAAWRTLELRHYDVQLIGSLALNDGTLAQMGTGEGKTLAATCALYLNALSGKGALVVTVNDYLARRDSEEMGQVFRFLGLTVGLVQSGMTPKQRKVAYASDVTYVTNSELGFDYLRDHLALVPSEAVLRSTLNFCVVDEGDSILVDEARTPLVIAGSLDIAQPTLKYDRAAKMAAVMKPGVHYELIEKEDNLSLTEEGNKFCEQALNVSTLFNPADPWAQFVLNAVKAKELRVKDKNYIVKGGEVLIIDEFSGRVQEGRRWGGGLHQAVEMKEGVEVRPEADIIASITYQSFFRRFEKVSAMTGTAITEAAEFAKVYGLNVVDVPPVLPKQRVDIPNSIYKSIKAKSIASLNELLDMHESGRPVLVGTTSVESSEAYSSKLRDINIRHEVLNAKPDSIAREAEIVAQAGRKGAVTIATNMAGRGTDILLGGSPASMARLRVRESLAAATGIDVPTVSSDFYPCDLTSEALKMIEDASASFKSEQLTKASENPDKPMLDRQLELDEMMAVAASAAAVYEGTAEDFAREAYEKVKEEYETTLADEREEVMKLGGLHVIATNLHDSRRIDDQLKGRAGRQGDPGSTHMFLSLEDRLFRIFGADKIKNLLDVLRVPEDTALESESVNDVVKEVQKKVEDYNYSLRTAIFDFDEVIASQRQGVYNRRDQKLGANAAETIDWLKEDSAQVVSDIFDTNWKSAGTADDAQAKAVSSILMQFFPVADITAAMLTGKDRDQAELVAKAASAAAVDVKMADLDNCKAGLGFESARYLALVTIDNLWKEHLKNMKSIQEYAGLQVYAQKREIDVYRQDGSELFDKMVAKERQNTIFSFFTYQPQSQ